MTSILLVDKGGNIKQLKVKNLKHEDLYKNVDFVNQIILSNVLSGMLILIILYIIYNFGQKIMVRLILKINMIFLLQ